jgi:hypothetical protein
MCGACLLLVLAGNAQQVKCAIVSKKNPISSTTGFTALLVMLLLLFMLLLLMLVLLFKPSLSTDRMKYSAPAGEKLLPLLTAHHLHIATLPSSVSYGDGEIPPQSLGTQTSQAGWG